jgi:hypothetical protein
MRTSRTIRLDVRPYHGRGEEPFEAIMAVVDALKERDQFLLTNSFEPTAEIALDALPNPFMLRVQHASSGLQMT